jgi:ATP-dependent HslUV protease ATP-binding subunit HslU
VAKSSPACSDDRATGVGKTEGRAAAVRRAPLPEGDVKYAGVGYVGRDVESMIRDLADVSIDMVREEDGGSGRAPRWAPKSACSTCCCRRRHRTARRRKAAARQENYQKTRELRGPFAKGAGRQMVEIEVRERSFPAFIVSSSGVEMDIHVRTCCRASSGQRKSAR